MIIPYILLHGYADVSQAKVLEYLLAPYLLQVIIIGYLWRQFIMRKPWLSPYSVLSRATILLGLSRPPAVRLKAGVGPQQSIPIWTIFDSSFNSGTMCVWLRYETSKN